MLSRRFMSRVASVRLRNWAPAITVTSRSFAKRSTPGDWKKQPAFIDPKSLKAEDIKEKLTWVENRLKEAELQKHSKKRGEEQIRKLLREETPKNRRINRNMIVVELRTLLHLRHALRHGAMRLKDLVKGNALGKSFLGEDTKINVSPDQAKQILFETFRYGNSGILESFQKKHKKKQEQIRVTQEAQAAAAARRAAAKKEQSNETDDEEVKGQGRWAAD